MYIEDMVPSNETILQTREIHLGFLRIILCLYNTIGTKISINHVSRPPLPPTAGRRMAYQAMRIDSLSYIRRQPVRVSGQLFVSSKFLFKEVPKHLELVIGGILE